MHPQARLHILFDCCHSGSACELPFVFRPDADGNVNMVDTVKKGLALVRGRRDADPGRLLHVQDAGTPRCCWAAPPTSSTA